MTTGTHPEQEAGLFVADFYPRLGEYLATQHAAGYDARAGRARFQAWLSEHADGVRHLVDPRGDHPGGRWRDKLRL